MKLKTLVAISATLALSVSGTPTASAGAGYYPTFPGDYIDLSVCLPKRHSGNIHLQVNNKTVAKFRMKPGVDQTFCNRKTELEYVYEWKVNTKLSGGLGFFDPKTKKLFWGWPDGIENTKKD
jgi:hypothetical protein